MLDSFGVIHFGPGSIMQASKYEKYRVELSIGHSIYSANLQMREVFKEPIIISISMNKNFEFQSIMVQI
jgi:hypothetical protein